MQDQEYQFDLSGGLACLDFVNTISRTAPSEREHLGRYQDLVAFARQAGIVSDDLAARLRVGAPVRALHPGVREAADGHDAALAWSWADAAVRLDAPLWPLVRLAAELLVGPELERVRECAAGDCRWLFLDTSKNRSRRWCDMKSCGNRAKVRRFYR